MVLSSARWYPSNKAPSPNRRRGFFGWQALDLWAKGSEKSGVRAARVIDMTAAQAE
jgi:hypothetical protein